MCALSSEGFNCSIKYKKFDITLQLSRENSISRFPAATIRGGFGITLRKLVCPTIEIACTGCILRQNCIYCYLFETIPASDAVRMRQYKAIPHPFTLWCAQQGDIVNVKLVLIGKAIKSLPYFVYTLNKLGSQGLGKGHIRYRLLQVHTDDLLLYEDGRSEVLMEFDADTCSIREAETAQGECTLDFYSPLLLRKDGRIVDRYDNYAFFATLLRRITTLYAIHCDGENLDDCKGLIQKWENSITAEVNMEWVRNKRFSTRQKREIDYDGFTGEVKLTGDIGTFLPFLEAGEILSVGKNTAFGFGKYRLKNLKWQ